MRPLLPWTAIVLLVLPLAGCGGSSSRSDRPAISTASAAPAHASSDAAERKTSSPAEQNATSPPHYAGVPPYPNDDDGDNDGNDDENIRTFGHPASAPEERAMVGVLKRYYGAAVREEGGRACEMLASGFRKAVPIQYGRYGASFERGHTCAVVMSKAFHHYHRLLSIEARRMKVIGARLEGEKGYVVVRPHSPCLREMCVLNLRELLIAKMLMQREGGSWKVEAQFLMV